MRKLLKSLLPSIVTEFLYKLIQKKRAITPIRKRTCNICNHRGWFTGTGRPYRLDACCPNCKSLERHRLIYSVMENGSISEFKNENAKILHFAPEQIIEKKLKVRYKNYVTADLFYKADIKLNIESIALPDDQYDIVIANHVLEHVDDRLAISEINRILKVGGIFVCMVPVVSGWKSTYERADIVTDLDRLLHFGQADHLRLYGDDFVVRVNAFGLSPAAEFVAEGEAVIDNGLLRGEKVFVFRKG